MLINEALDRAMAEHRQMCIEANRYAAEAMRLRIAMERIVKAADHYEMLAIANEALVVT